MKRILFILFVAGVLLTACSDSLRYSTFKSTPTNGWDKNEPVKFEVPPFTEEGTYNVSVGLRLSDDFQFRNLHILVQQRLYPAGLEFTDTLIYDVVDERGNILGQGVNYYQYERPARSLTLQEGDSLAVTIKHIMKREILPGILNVGVIINKK